MTKVKFGLLMDLNVEDVSNVLNVCLLLGQRRLSQLLVSCNSANMLLDLGIAYRTSLRISCGTALAALKEVAPARALEGGLHRGRLLLEEFEAALQGQHLHVAQAGLS